MLFGNSGVSLYNLVSLVNREIQIDPTSDITHSTRLAMRQLEKYAGWEGPVETPCIRLTLQLF